MAPNPLNGAAQYRMQVPRVIAHIWSIIKSSPPVPCVNKFILCRTVTPRVSSNNFLKLNSL